MSFATPEILYLLVLPALLLAWVWWRESGRVVLPLDHGQIRHRRVLAAVVGAAESIPACLAAVALLLLAGPTRLGEPQERRALTNIEFCLDCSSSMTSPFGDGSRYDASLAAINQFLDYRTGDAFGLTFFGNNVLHWTPLTSDVSAFRCAPPFMNPSNPQHPYWLGGTLIGKALLACKERLLTREEGDRMVILVSDGESADLGNGADEEIARTLRAANVVVFGIHTGGGEAPAPVANICGLTGGAVFSPSDPTAMTSVFQRIDQMQKAELEKTAAEVVDYFFPCCVAGLLLVGFATIAQFGLRYTPW